MSHQLIVRSTAERDLLVAFQYYESVVPGLGTAFIQRVDEAIAAITLAPVGFRKRHGEFRLLVVNRFPYGVFYLFDGTVFLSSRLPRSSVSQSSSATCFNANL